MGNYARRVSVRSLQNDFHSAQSLHIYIYGFQRKISNRKMKKTEKDLSWAHGNGVPAKNIIQFEGIKKLKQAIHVRRQSLYG